MLNKDEYNEDEYNDYYARETRGAGISRKSDDSGGDKKVLLILILLAIIGVGGYLGFKSVDVIDTVLLSSDKDMNRLDNRTKSDSNSTDDIVKKEKHIKYRISGSGESSEEMETSISLDNANGKINPEDIANIVQMVMQKMNSEKALSAPTEKPAVVTAEDMNENRLINSLKDTKVDSLVTQLNSVDVTSKDSGSSSKDGKDKTDTYNKVLVKSGISKTDELSRLSEEISSVILEDSKESDKSSEYTKFVEKEVKSRKKEMRYIIVKKGDTLGKIAKRVYGNVMDYKKIYEANPDVLRRPDKVYIGQRLRVPE